MTKLFTRLFFLFFSFSPFISYSQSTLIFFDDFETADTIDVEINSGDVGTNTGRNDWIINNNYTGLPIFPNTITQDSIIGGGGITNPNGYYLHIHDSNISSVSNANFDPNAPSDRFVTLGPFCTLGYSNVHFAFYYLCSGNANSYGELWYSADGGAWTQTGQTKYDSTYKWTYQDVTDIAFENHQSLRFGFRWINGTSTDTTTSFAIDEVKLAGQYDPVKYPVKLTITSLLSSPTCQQSTVDVFFSLSAPLCGLGNYAVLLSDSNGSFAGSIDTSYFALSNASTFQAVFINISKNLPPASCYRVKVIRIDVVPNIEDSSGCLQVIVCPNSINVQPPVMLSNPYDTICVGSVIDVPFYSFGVFKTNNTYIAQLSDSNGNFTTPINNIASLASANTYSSLPGYCSGKLLPGSQPIPSGCKYYIRVISTIPADTSGNLYGPFCIRDCNIQTDSTDDITLCIPSGIDTCIWVRINQYNDSLLKKSPYLPGNTFQIEVHSSMTYALLYKGGIQQIVTADSDTCVQFRIPDVASFNAITAGMGPGIYYIRIVADSNYSTEPWNVLGTLVRLTVGIPFPSPLQLECVDPNNFTTVPAPADTAICENKIMDFEFTPYNPTSTYDWYVYYNGNWSDKGSGPFFSLIFNILGDIKISVVETNFGCQGPGSDTLDIQSLGLPSTTITGPTPVCVGDTVQFSAPFQLYAYYYWSSPTGTIVSTSNNKDSVVFTQPGIQNVKIQVTGFCGSPPDRIKNINVLAPPVVNAGNDTTVCKLDSVHLSTTSGSYLYQWSTGATTQSIIVTPDTTTTYIATAGLSVLPKCTASDTVKVTVRYPVIDAPVNDSICPQQKLPLNAAVPGATYIWSTGATTQSITVSDSGAYLLKFKTDTAICNTQVTYSVTLKSVDLPLMGPDTSICAGNSVILDAGITGDSYAWTKNNDSAAILSSNKTIVAADTGIYIATINYVNGRCSDKRIIHIGTEGCPLDFYNVITPNGDGLNDYWFNYRKTFFPVFEVKIWDRWGLLIYESSDPLFKWYGVNMSGKAVSDGVYYWIVNAGNDNGTQELHGFVTVVAGKGK